MAYKNTLLRSNGCLKLIQSINDAGKKRYLVKYNGWPPLHCELETIFNPIGNRKVAGINYMWKFGTKHEAEQVMSIAVLKGLSESQW